jgi:hypothetical protein
MNIWILEFLDGNFIKIIQELALEYFFEKFRILNEMTNSFCI